MSGFGGITKVNGDWTADEKVKLQTFWRLAEQKFVKKRKAEGYDLKNIAIPLPNLKSLKKYKRDAELKEFLQPYQAINPFGLKKPIVY